MPCKVFHGRSAKLIGQFSGQAAYRQPPASADAIVLPFSTIELARNPLRPDDDTVRGGELAQRRYEQDQSPDGKASSKFWLNEMGFWLKAMFGDPVTTGTGPYTHVFTLNLSAPPDALLELSMTDGTDNRFNRFLGMVVSRMNLQPFEDTPKWDADLFMSHEIRPRPTTAWDSDPTSYAGAQLKRCTGIIADEIGTNTLGEISKSNFEFNMALDPQHLADGNEGHSCILVGEPSITGTMNALFTAGTLMDFAEDNTAKRLQLTMNDGADTNPLSLALDIPEVEFDEPAHAVTTKQGLVVDVAWRATQHASNKPTITLVSDVEAY